ncbi:disease resistance protein RPV1-like [Juglans microcarpa x Juglans regia]|uniref:disease resistance protein RPV1-like n=1 Tax=Juglans microcarpa x Juglans regia TaxID=2249226 RepID=UPI001B7EFA0A|nr:disease resistance protein RPV1-like [Juglans microcarpa x Juglans regia]
MCLMRELAEIVRWEKKTKLITIIPIFYHVDPSNVRNQRGTFAEAFAKHEKDPKVDIKEIDMWRNAFRKVSNFVGEHIHDRYKSTIIQDISRRISRELNSRFSHLDYNKLVAIDSQVDKMMKLLDMESNNVRFVGIHGMGGVGKKTLAQIIYDRVSNSNCRFEGSSFISRIRENSTIARDLASLQKELIFAIMQEKIDGGEWKWFGPGSRVIITCRDSHLLRTHGVNDIYKVEQLGIEKALQLFSLSAFKKTHPTENYMDLFKHFVKSAEGLPLALKVLGSFLFGRTMDAWESEREKLKAILNPKIMDVLQISFNGLQELQKELFLDMVCFFGGRDIFSNMLLERFGHYCIDLDVLVERSLVSKTYQGTLIMHDLLKELGKEIVRRECPEEPGRRSRLFCHEDVFNVLKNDTGTDATKAIVVDFCPETKDQRLNAKALSKMRKLRYFEIHHSRTLKWRRNPLKYLPTIELRYLELPGYYLKSFPSSFQLGNLTVLRMPFSRMKQLWKGSMVLPNLKFFDLDIQRT